MKYKMGFYIVFLLGGMCSLGVSATELQDQKIVLKKRCLTANPLVVNEDDSSLLTIYTQICDKANKNNQTVFLIQAAQRFQVLGKNFKALQIIHQLEESNVKSNTITDVKFLAATQIANSAIQQIRTQEIRFLNTSDTYPAAKQLVDAIQAAKPESILIEEAKSTQHSIDQSNVNNTVKAKKKSIAKVIPKPQKTVVTSQPTIKNTSNEKNPFAGL